MNICFTSIETAGFDFQKLCFTTQASLVSLPSDSQRLWDPPWMISELYEQNVVFLDLYVLVSSEPNFMLELPARGQPRSQF